ncbi:iron complex transport system ATP-binding protein [Sphingobium xenophagum]|uniref:Iron complex transport system ATP-binding protein n=1 Tax=Sphingobium xenophagum TaxID=121428 RepID=A0ABU1X321_SPHXE|nr:ABC transporter ATP-binding protein [Sphingobium xenophagum]MDR7155974.1 iron complex transport system ATP-binding protein [Sphingobium xenophagum]
MVTIRVEGLCARLGRRAVLHDIDATLAPGALIGIIGPNGAGKSTLVRAMLGLINTTRGRVTIDGRAIATLPPRERARAIAYLPQGQTLHWPLSVERLVALGRLPHLGPMSRIGAADHDAIGAAMARTDVAHLAGRIATELSGGERARVMLARALAVGAPGLAVDEPLAALDPGHQIDVMQMLAREAQVGGLVIAVLHDLSMAARYCDRLLLLDRGTLVADGAPDAVLTQDRLRAVYGITSRIDLTATPPLVAPLDRWTAASDHGE